MFLSAYYFDGDPDRLLAGYDRMMATLPPKLDLHACVSRETGITVYDGCPTREEFVEFSSGEGFRTALAAAGLPMPRIEPLGEVHGATVPR
ncbi:hypothetical protein [Amycolatopsis sp. NPDC051128]|uniref:hypothetical protein n=1 Tax=Amycolatopsis sp. NPDC051128 TaxID=3155412 RepID=UPI003448C548